MNIRTSVAAATAVANYDLIQNDVNNRAPFGRVIDGIALVGSAAAGDTVVELMVNNKSEGKYSNSTTGTAVQRDRDLIPLDVFVPANALVQVFVRTAPTTNPIVTMLEFGKPAVRAGGRRTRTGWTRRQNNASLTPSRTRTSFNRGMY